MRILFVATNVTCPGANGGSTHVTEVVGRLRATDDVLLVARRESTLANTLAIGPKLPPAGLRQLTALRLLRRAWPAVRTFRPDVIYDRGSSFGLGSALGRLTGAPVVYMVLDGHRTRFALATAARIITTLPQLVPEPYAAKVTRVHWGAATDRFHPDLDGRPVRQRLGIPADRIVVCYSGGFYRWHGLDKLVSAAGRLRALPLTFLLVGAGAHLGAIRQRVDREGLADRFIFTGAVEYGRVAEHVAAADICVAPYQPSLSRALRLNGHLVNEPLKVYEFLAAGKATITLDCESVRHHFEGGRELLLVSSDSVDELVTAIERLATRPDERQRLGRAGRERVVGRLSWDAHVTHLRSIFEEVRASRSHSAAGTDAPTG